MAKFTVKADFEGKIFGEVFGTIEAESAEEAVRLASEGEIEWDYWRTFDEELEEMSEFTATPKETTDDTDD